LFIYYISVLAWKKLGHK